MKAADIVPNDTNNNKGKGKGRYDLEMQELEVLAKVNLKHRVLVTDAHLVSSPLLLINSHHTGMVMEK